MIRNIDYFVLIVKSIDHTCAFYERAPGFQRIDTPGRPTAMGFGEQKINVHQKSHEFEPKADRPTPGSGDFCLIADVPLDDVVVRLSGAGVEIELGPVPRNGALGPMTSVYFRDPDANLVEVGVYS